MFAVVVTIFMVCWAPYHIYFIYSYHNPSITKMPYISHIYLGFYWLAMSNTCVNPIIYYWMNRRFRAYFDMFLFCVPRYLKRATSSNWPVDSQLDNSMSRITRTKSCPARHKYQSQHQGVSTIPVRAMGLKHSMSFGPEYYANQGRPQGLYRPVRSSSSFIMKMRSMDSIKSQDSVLTQAHLSEELF